MPAAFVLCGKVGCDIKRLWHRQFGGLTRRLRFLDVRNIFTGLVVVGILYAGWEGVRWVFNVKPPLPPSRSSACPPTTAEYRSGFLQFKTQLEETKVRVTAWVAVRKEMEAAQRQDPIKFCQKHTDHMAKIKAEIPVTELCPGESANPSGSKKAGAQSLMLAQFRECSEGKSKEIGKEIKRRGSGEKTAHLHALLKELTSVDNQLLMLLNESREQTQTAAQARCWLDGVLRDCRR
ncbi:MAG: hypothetical protein ACREC6_10000 [Hyphomicrobiaceae bacterium]